MRVEALLPVVVLRAEGFAHGPRQRLCGRRVWSWCWSRYWSFVVLLVSSTAERSTVLVQRLLYWHQVVHCRTLQHARGTEDETLVVLLRLALADEWSFFLAFGARTNGVVLLRLALADSSGALRRCCRRRRRSSRAPGGVVEGGACRLAEWWSEGRAGGCTSTGTGAVAAAASGGMVEGGGHAGGCTITGIGAVAAAAVAALTMSTTSPTSTISTTYTTSTTFFYGGSPPPSVLGATRPTPQRASSPPRGQ